MIKFFRKIRQQLLNENKFSKYLLYAIGEIFLVVIGILIALQINTWNKNKIEAQKEYNALVQMKDGLITDKVKIEAELIDIEKDLSSIKYLEDLLEDPTLPYNTTMDTLFGTVYGIRNISLNKAFYEDLKSTGIQLIKNDGIRSKVVDLYENNYEMIFSFITMEYHVNDVVRPYYLSHFQDIVFKEFAHPNDYEKIWNDPYYKNIVNYRYKTLKTNHIVFFNSTINDIQQLVDEIDTYLNNN